jgi:hypothetical protein
MPLQQRCFTLGAIRVLPVWSCSIRGCGRKRARRGLIFAITTLPDWLTRICGAKSAVASSHFATALRSLLALVGQVWRGGSGQSTGDGDSTAVQTPEPNQPPLPERMAEGLRHFKGRVLLILSGDDLTAAEFRDTVKASRRWRRLLAQPQVTIRELPAANHTFSRREWRDQVAAWTREWLADGTDGSGFSSALNNTRK